MSYIFQGHDLNEADTFDLETASPIVLYIAFLGCIVCTYCVVSVWTHCRPASSSDRAHRSESGNHDGDDAQTSLINKSTATVSMNGESNNQTTMSKGLPNALEPPMNEGMERYSSTAMSIDRDTSESDEDQIENNENASNQIEIELEKIKNRKHKQTLSGMVLDVDPTGLNDYT